MEEKQSTPSVIAKLMGLDEVPPQQPSYRQHKVLSDEYLRKTASIGLIEKSSLRVGRLSRITAEKHHEIKHVFDSKIRKTDKVSAQSISDVKSNPSRVRAQFNFGRQKNSYAQQFQSMDKKLYHTVEPSGMLEDLYVTRDNSLRYLNRSNLSTKQLHDPSALQLHLHSGHATAPIITSAPNYKESELCKQSGKTLTKRTVLRSIQKLENECGESDTVYLNELLKSHPELKDKASNFSTRIVLLKPNSGKAQNYAKNLLLLRSDMLCESGDPEYRQYREHFKSESSDLNIKVTETENTTSDTESSRHSFRNPRRVEKQSTQEEKKNNGNSSRLASRSRATVDDSSQSLPKAVINFPQGNFHWGKRARMSNPFLGRSFFATEAKKQNFERWKTTKSLEEFKVLRRGCTLGQMFAMNDGEAMPKSMYSKLEKNCLSSALCLQKENSELGSSILSSKVGSTNEYIRKLPGPKLLKNSSIAAEHTRLKPRSEAFRKWSSGKKEVTDNHHKLNRKNFYIKNSLASKDAEVICEKQQYFPGSDLEANQNPDYKFSSSDILLTGSDDNISVQVNQGLEDGLEKDVHKEADDHSSFDVWGNLTKQKSSYDSPRGELIHRCTRNLSELAMNLRETNQPSPDSVLEAPFMEENFFASELFDSPVSDLSGLALKLQLLDPNSEETNSEVSGMAVSSDEDTEKGSVNFSQDNEKLWGPLRPEESRDFSYLIDVLDEANLSGLIQDMGRETWESGESPVGPSVFEALEKKYGKQTAWQKSERRLLFDRICSGLREILDSCMDFRTSAKPLRRRFTATLRRDDIEEELWMLLISQEREVAKDLSEKVLGREMRWLELEDDISIICKEMVDLLFDELAAEICSSEST